MIRPEHRPSLAPKARLRVDGLTGETFLLYPERGLRLNATASEILRLCDSRNTVDDIVAALASQNAGNRMRVAAEVADFLESLRERGLLQGCES
jgi:coenzyme PQQ biosynthesis protein PqqD